MNIARSIGAWTTAAALTLGAGCKSRGAELAELLPQPPAGWKVEQPASGEDVAGAGARGKIAYAPSGGNPKGVKKVEVYVYVLERGADKKTMAELRKYPFETTGFYSSAEVAGLKASEAAPMPSERHLLSVFAAPEVTVDLIAWKSGEGFDESKSRAVHGIAEAIDYKKLTGPK